jgi:hypothetical protein
MLPLWCFAPRSAFFAQLAIRALMNCCIVRMAKLTVSLVFCCKVLLIELGSWYSARMRIVAGATAARCRRAACRGSVVGAKVFRVSSS